MTRYQYLNLVGHIWIDCGRDGLMWDHNHHDAGRWRLWEGDWPDGQLHVCRRKAEDDFEAIE